MTSLQSGSRLVGALRNGGDLAHATGCHMAYLLLIGTRKGLFTARGEDRRTWEPDGPHRLDEADDADTVYAGVEPHALFRSTDDDDSFTLVRALWEHPHRVEWFPGAGGGGLRRLVLRAEPPRGPPQLRPATVGWSRIETGLPTDLGFAVVAHPHRPESAWNLPVVSQEVHLPPGNRLSAYRTDDSGATWRAVDDGLPQGPYFGIVLRDAACADGSGTIAVSCADT